MAKRKSQPKIENRRALALSRKEAEQRRRALLALGGVGLLVVLVLIFGLAQTYIIAPNQPVAIVNGVEISRQAYQNRVLYERYLLDEQAALVQLQYQQFAESLQGEDSGGLLAQLQDQANQQYTQILNQRAGVDRDALEILIEEQLVAAEAAQRNITVSEAELDETYNEIAAARSGGYTEAAVAQTVTARQNATATAAQFTPTPTQPGSEATPAPTLPPQPTPTNNTISDNKLTEAVTTWQNTMRQNANMTPDALRELVRRRLLREKLIESFGQEIETVTLQTHARHILVNTEAEAISVTKRLQAGEPFEVVAAQVSTDPTSPGGDLGWFSQGDMVAPFDEAAFSLDIGAISDPVETQFGWHIIQVLEREERELDEASLSRQRLKAYNTWLQQARTVGVQDLWSAGDAPPDANAPLQSAASANN
ncbi:MAG: peptidylprolyl isomerase [Anaerolineae bacterium]